MAFAYFGFEERNYKDRSGTDRKGYNIFIAECIPTGYKFLLRFNYTTRSNSLYFVSTERFHDLGLDNPSLSVPADIKDIYFDNYGNIKSINWA